MKKICLAVIMLFAISSCATIETRSEGNKIDKQLIESIKPGVTTKKAIIETFGYPSKSNKKEDGTEEFIYNHVEKNVSSYFSGFIIKEKNAPTTSTALEIIIKDDIVIGYKFIKTAE
ncbi:MAG: hypothetical protein HZB79_06150 [Deltaproteobacteria bacterium]|nr:hypothetical protein [Deltaproteobacteria bacterium]